MWRAPKPCRKSAQGARAGVCDMKHCHSRKLRVHVALLSTWVNCEGDGDPHSSLPLHANQKKHGSSMGSFLRLIVYHTAILLGFAAVYASLISSPEHIEITSANTERSRITALYMAVSTHTTVGYGDIVPASTRARLLTSLHMLLVFLATIGALAN